MRQHGGKNITFEVTCDQMVKIAPQIYIRAGLATHKGEASIDIQAPKDILILRGDIYHQLNPAQLTGKQS